MLYIIAVVLIALWLLGLLTSTTMSGFIHILLVIAVIYVRSRKVTVWFVDAHWRLAWRHSQWLMIGYTLDLAGGMSRAAWGVSFLLVAVLMLAALVAFRLMRPRELAGDRRT